MRSLWERHGLTIIAVFHGWAMHDFPNWRRSGRTSIAVSVKRCALYLQRPFILILTWMRKGREIRRPFVREDVCVGCGFCEKVCPVLGTSAIVVEGIQPQTKVKRPKEILNKNFLPETLGDWKRISGPNIYEGKEKLYEYIDGGAEPYLSYSFIRVSNAEYVKEANRKKILIDIWEFGSPEDAFGVFSKDRAGTDIKLGNGSALFNNYLYLWNDTYFIRIEPREGDVLPEDVIYAGKSIINIMPYKKVSLPFILSLLPQQHLVQESPIFFHKKIVLDNIYISDNYIEENVFHLSEKLMQSSQNTDPTQV